MNGTTSFMIKLAKIIHLEMNQILRRLNIWMQDEAVILDCFN